MKKYCFINNKIIEEKNAHINPYDLGILRGYGIFDFMCTANGKLFLFTDHWNRLNHSARLLDIPIPMSKKEYEKNIYTLLKKNKLQNAGIKTVLTAGISDDGFTPSNKPTFYIITSDMKKHTFPKKLYERGAKIITHEFARSHAKSKTTNYIEAIKSQKQKNKKNATEILYTNKNTVLECTTSNIFIIKNKKLITPKDDVLHGVTRKIVLQLAKKSKIETIERKITIKQLLAADEVFITGSAKHILPVTKIDTIKMGNGIPGTLTKELMRLYKNYFDNY